MSLGGSFLKRAGKSGMITKIGGGIVGVSLLSSMMGGNSSSNPISSVVSGGFDLLTGGNLVPLIGIGVAAYLFIR
jgi:hypothetical protein